MSEPRHFAYLDSVRALAFLAVISVHVAMATGSFPGKSLLLFGGFGVQLFFLASAITLCQSMSERKQIDRYPVAFFYLRRLFRIAPLFWLAMAFYWLIPSLVPPFLLADMAPSGVHASYFWLTAFFLHGWHPYTFDSIVPGGWSIAVEMTFYLIFPLLFFFINSLRRAVIAVFISFFYLKFMLHRGWPCDSLFPFLESHVYSGTPKGLLGFFMGLWFPAQLPVFLVGFLAFYLLREPLVQKAMASKFWTRSLLVFCGLALLNWAKSPAVFMPNGFQIDLTLAGVVIALSGAATRLLVNPIICRLGRISYSCYLVHFAAFGLVVKWLGHGAVLTSVSPSIDAGSRLANLLLFARLFIPSLLLTVVFATITYRFLEQPGIELGRRLIRRISARARHAVLSGAAT
jgi:peptidoglycan/LPS O-acetylase OafA/YrhL